MELAIEVSFISCQSIIGKSTATKLVAERGFSEKKIKLSMASSEDTDGRSATVDVTTLEAEFKKDKVEQSQILLVRETNCFY